MEANLPVGIRTNSFLFIRQHDLFRQNKKDVNHKTTKPISLHNLCDLFTYDIWWRKK